ncbi:MAG: hypothetical protein JJU02_17070 [Cryomorphaceae bacterium]|nr:hypothetical protein [Cryomorphaceae bacterium]
MSGDHEGYKDYSPENESLFNFVERISIHESTHGLVNSGVWKERDVEFRRNNPGSNIESFPQERERLWLEEKNK